MGLYRMRCEGAHGRGEEAGTGKACGVVGWRVMADGNRIQIGSFRMNVGTWMPFVHLRKTSHTDQCIQLVG